MRKVLAVFFIVSLGLSLFAELSQAAEKRGFLKNLWRKATGKAQIEQKAAQKVAPAPVRPIVPPQPPPTMPKPIESGKIKVAVPKAPPTTKAGFGFAASEGEEEGKEIIIEAPDFEMVPPIPKVDAFPSAPTINVPVGVPATPQAPEIGSIPSPGVPGDIGVLPTPDVGMPGTIEMPKIPDIPDIQIPELPDIPAIGTPGAAGVTNATDALKITPTPEDIRIQTERIIEEVKRRKLEEEMRRQEEEKRQKLEEGSAETETEN